MCDLSSLASLSQHELWGLAYTVAQTSTSYSWQSIIPLYGYTSVCLFIY